MGACSRRVSFSPAGVSNPGTYPQPVDNPVEKEI